MFDIISGCAGALIVALRIYEREQIKELLEFAIECGEHLLNHVFIKDEIYGWHTITGEGEILAGMSHGNTVHLELGCPEFYAKRLKQKLLMTRI